MAASAVVVLGASASLEVFLPDRAHLTMALALRVPIATFDGGLAAAARSNKAKLYFPT